jgi:hypothetical protein
MQTMSRLAQVQTPIQLEKINAVISLYEKKLRPKFPPIQHAFNMFDGSNFPKSLDEEVFNRWLENGRLSKIRYNYLLIVWDAYESKYLPIYAERPDEIEEYESYKASTGRESLVAAYNLYSESRII